MWEIFLLQLVLAAATDPKEIERLGEKIGQMAFDR
jgi:hypothetical protein